jgi:hypothetical protein
LDFGFWILDWTRSTGIFQNRKNCNPFPRLIWKRYSFEAILELVEEILDVDDVMAELKKRGLLY